MNTHTQFNRLGVPKRFGSDWTPDEDNLMRRDYQILGAKGMKVILPNRSKGSICARAKKLGLSRTWVLAEIEEELPRDEMPLVKHKPDDE